MTSQHLQRGKVGFACVRWTVPHRRRQNDRGSTGLRFEALLEGQKLPNRRQLPANLKKVIDNNSGVAASQMASKIWDGTIAPARKSAMDKKAVFNTITAAEYERWKKATENVAADWFTEVGARAAMVLRCSKTRRR